MKTRKEIFKANTNIQKTSHKIIVIKSTYFSLNLFFLSTGLGPRWMMFSICAGSGNSAKDPICDNSCTLFDFTVAARARCFSGSSIFDLNKF